MAGLAEMEEFPNLDSAKRWIFVDRKNHIEFDGLVYSVEFYAGSTNRPLVVGIFRPNGGGACDFDLVAKYNIASSFVNPGYVKVKCNVICF